MLEDEMSEASPNHRGLDRAVDDPEPVEQALDLVVGLLELFPAVGDRTLAFAPEEVEAHLDPVERIGASMAEAAQDVTEAFDAFGVRDDLEHLRGKPLLRRFFARLQAHRVKLGRRGDLRRKRKLRGVVMDTERTMLFDPLQGKPDAVPLRDRGGRRKAGGPPEVGEPASEDEEGRLIAIE
jgi:hypothetical protein